MMTARYLLLSCLDLLPLYNIQRTTDNGQQSNYRRDDFAYAALQFRIIGNRIAHRHLAGGVGMNAPTD
jgi:hypothetical protein